MRVENQHGWWIPEELLARWKSFTRLRNAKTLPSTVVGRWVPISEVLPPERFPVLVTMVAEHLAPQFAWLKYAAGDVYSPFFVCAARAGLAERGMIPFDLRQRRENNILDPEVNAEWNRLHAVGYWYSPAADPMLWPSEVKLPEPELALSYSGGFYPKPEPAEEVPA